MERRPPSTFNLLSNDFPESPLRSESSSFDIISSTSPVFLSGNGHVSKEDIQSREIGGTRDDYSPVALKILEFATGVIS
ncbi:hypothetical protein M413DRAFT_285609 [Hebeloma cylindrosporum]|uniref:Uncharacterized protein n=1 Tax=Hebeloma cylindrosporum TaxID=76867 RepID=A0A0C2Y6G1_HEBCY|nr:hypothetical protein M413DRAFT_285609 [Hebeloma cylindrosporum h7]